MFYLSKIFWLLVQPLSLAFFLAALAALACLLRRRTIGGWLAGLSALTLFVTLYTTAGNVLLQSLEDRITRPDRDPQTVSCIIMLGGGVENEVMSGRGGVEFNAAADRYTETLRLALAHPEAKILVSGGDGSFSGRYEGEAGASAHFFKSFGVQSERLIRENASRNTWENTLNTKELLEQDGLKDCLLVTSAFHMPRSLALFAKAGIAVTPWPVDYRTSGKLRPGLDFTQPSLNAQNTATAVREWLGILGYYWAGRIHWPS